MNEHPDHTPVVTAAPITEGLPKATTRNSSTRSKSSNGKPPSDLGLLFLTFGVLLPCFTLGFELLTHACANDFFDPIPTWWHVVLVATVPLSNFLIWLGWGRHSWKASKGLMLLAGASVGISAIYGAMYAPMAPFACIGIMFVGFGFIPLTPLIAFGLAVRAWMKMAMMERVEKRLLPGFAVGIAALAIPFGWDLLTYDLLQRATKGSEEQRTSAVRWLRAVGHWDEVLTTCYRNPRGPWSFMGSAANALILFDRAEVQKVYYRLTGVAYNSQPPPASVSLMGRRGFGQWNFDPHVGGERVADKVAGLSMESSRLDAKVDPVGLTSYTEWTLVFKNVAANPSEARAQVELPPGGVVSRLTLWINGEPQEAAFGGRAQVRAAYQEVAVVQRRDPVLVTTSGPDRILMQCFPVPPGGEMKVRMGITAPLRLVSRQKAEMDWPTFVETNFEPGPSLRHAAWVESPKPLQNSEKTFRAEWNDKQFAKTSPLPIPLDEAKNEVLADDPTSADFVIRQTIEEETMVKPSKLVVVIDGSRSMRKVAQGIKTALGALGSGNEIVFLASDSVQRMPAGMTLSQWMERQDFAGGCDNIPALESAWDEASKEPDGAILWVHGPQPVLLNSIDPLLQRIERSAHKPTLYLAPIEPVENRTLERIGGLVNSKQLRGASELEGRLNHCE